MCEEARVLMQSRRCHMFLIEGGEQRGGGGGGGVGVCVCVWGGGCLRSKVDKSLHKLSHVRSVMAGQEETLMRRAIVS